MGESINKVCIASTPNKLIRKLNKALSAISVDISIIPKRIELDKTLTNREANFVIVHLDEKEFSPEKIVSILEFNKEESNTPVLIINPFQLDQLTTTRFFVSGFTEVVSDTIPSSLIIAKVCFHLQLHNGSRSVEHKDAEIYQQIKKLKVENAKLRSEAKKNKQTRQKMYRELSNEIEDNLLVKMELQKKNQLLTAKNRTLYCINEISKLSHVTTSDLDDFLSRAVDTILSSFQPAQLASVEIQYGEKVFLSNNFRKLQAHISCNFNLSKSPSGRIIFYYGNNRGNNHSFLDGEKQLLSIVSAELEQIIHQKEADQKLTIFERAIDQSPLMISITNATSKNIEYINQKFLEVSGYNKDQLNHAIQPSNDKKLQSLNHKMREQVLAGKTWTDTYQHQTKDGQLFWKKSASYPIYEQEKITHILSIGEDISREIKITEELKTTKKNYEHITENAPGGIFLVNHLGNFLYVNKKACRISGYSAGEILKFHIRDLVHPDDYDRINQNLHARLQGKTPENEYEAKLITKTGEIKTVEVSGLKTEWKGKVVDFIVVNDITTKKRLNNLLNIQNRIDYLGTISRGMNTSFSQIFEVLFEFDWLDLGTVYLINEIKSGFDQVFIRGASKKFIESSSYMAFSSEKYKLVKNKKPLYLKGLNKYPELKPLVDDGCISIFVVPLIMENKLIGLLSLASKNRLELADQERKIFEAIGHKIAQMVVLIENQDRLETKRSKLQESLKQVNEKQQLLIQKSKLESLGEMAAGVAHEINQPLGVIQLSLENMAFKVAANKSTPAYLNKKLTSIFKNINKIEEIIAHIRTFSRDQKSIVIDKVDVNAVIIDAFSLVKELYKYHDISILLSLEEKKTEVLGNRHKLEQVLYNLLSNAKFALDEKENLSGESRFEKVIQIRTYHNKEKVFIELEDNGIGIEKKHLENIFSPFFTTKPEGVGTGLGLSIVYGIITEMSGSITIESKQAAYTLARIELPKIS